MAKSEGQKLKLLYLKELLEEQSDENHLITTQQMIDYLAAHNITAERKAIYHDIACLQEFGMDILQKPGRNGGYYLASREFELPELKLLVDAVQSSRFLTSKKSMQLIEKLSHMVSVHEAGSLKRQVVVSGRVKTMNESIYYNVDKIHDALSAGVMICFQYFEWTPDKQQNLRHGGEVYEISPWALNWDDENYYMIGFDHVAARVKYYRVDKMIKIQLTANPRQGREYLQDLNLADFSRKTFGMFDGQEQELKIRFSNHLAGVVIDRFGKDIPMRPDTDTTFAARLRVTVSGQFFGWLAGLGPGVRILSPENAAREYQAYLQKLLQDYTT